ncbi:hypothetical protein AVE30378_03675 [Achromobacter veterisilvae]|uniref:NADP-dependent oxidoreductase domain-containing protein n=1 Tax=Achromobacter veterisilvae TaxID=2069367 RepID=A0A446CP94_9BURK|nr:aldo/keto reductase [Achromobacter veterisilvae]SSW69710.1 hypothetical protein AVE30378_03675 [Achromobacter veterisilvae]
MNQRLALGTAQFGLAYGIANQTGRVAPEAVERILAEARSAGVDTLDTAVAYGDSELALGEAGVAGWRIISKLPAVPDNCGDCGEWVRNQVDGSLQRLRVGALYGLLLHRPEQLLGPHGPALAYALRRLKQDGVVEKIGVSIYAPQELATLLQALDIDMVQAPFNLLDQRMLETGWADRLKTAGIELHVRSVFLQGLLLIPRECRPAKFDRWGGVWQEWERWLRAEGLLPMDACLRFALAASAVDKVVVGVDSVEQLRGILDVSHTPLRDLPSWPTPVDTDLLNPARWTSL